ncbi:aspartate/glutamate racemase family protein [Rouxiella badensis]|uniref:aspartate/glutamate racemase family protein n=1 Tax=Rouxiella badensis TaxID=1646377 RepID=UPI00301D466C
MRIHCLHTAESNIAVFNAAAAQINVPAEVITHHVRSDLLDACEKAGGLTDEICQLTADYLLALSQDADSVVLTCSTLGAAAERAALNSTVPILRVDKALAETALAQGKEIAVLYAVETTRGPTEHLFSQQEGYAQANVRFEWVAGAWDMFKAGNGAGYLQQIAASADKAYEVGADIVVLAQASMAGAAELTQFGTPLTSPICGLRAAVSA